MVSSAEPHGNLRPRGGGTRSDNKGAMTKNLLSIVIAGGIATLAVLTLPQKAEPAPSGPPVSWAPDRLVVGIAPGERRQVRATATARRCIPATETSVVPALAPFVVAAPTSNPPMTTGTQAVFDLTFTAGATETPQTIAGTIRLRHGSSTIARPLPVTLKIIDESQPPPDPGSAGDATLQGIDSDSDGVRDDIQRFIVSTHADSRRTRTALRQAARVLQTSILDTTDAVASVAHGTALLQALGCLDYVRPADGRAIYFELKARHLNTPSRSRAKVMADKHFSGHSYAAPPPEQRKALCAFDPDVMED